MRIYMEKKRVIYLDLLRAIAFVCIIIYHFMIELELHEKYSFVQQGIFYENENMHIATLGVSLFFIVSGAGLMLSTRQELKLKSYIKRRVLRILIPFYLVYFSYLCFRFVVERRLPFDPTIPEWRIVFTLLGMDEYVSLLMGGGYTYTLGIGEWFLGCLMLMYAAFPLLRLGMLKNKKLLFGGATIVYLFVVWLYPFEIPMHTNFFVKIYEFILGMFLALSWEKIGKKSLIATIPIIAAFLFIPVSFPVPSGLKITILSTAVTLLVMQFETWLSDSDILNKILGKINEFSFELFLVHHICIQEFIKWFMNHHLGTKEVALLFVIVFSVMTVLAVLLKKAELIILKKIEGK